MDIVKTGWRVRLHEMQDAVTIGPNHGQSHAHIHHRHTHTHALTYIHHRVDDNNNNYFDE